MIETGNEFIYALVPEIVDRNLGKDGLVAVVFGGSYAEHKWDPSGDIDMDLVFQSPLNVNHALTVLADIKQQFASNKLSLDVRLCVDTSGNAIFIHNEQKRLRFPEAGKVKLSGLYDHTNIIYPNGFSF